MNNQIVRDNFFAIAGKSNVGYMLGRFNNDGLFHLFPYRFLHGFAAATSEQILEARQREDVWSFFLRMSEDFCVSATFNKIENHPLLNLGIICVPRIKYPVARDAFNFAEDKCILLSQILSGQAYDIQVYPRGHFNVQNISSEDISALQKADVLGTPVAFCNGFISGQGALGECSFPIESLNPRNSVYEVMNRLLDDVDDNRQEFDMR